MVVLLILGSIFTAGGIGIYLFGRKRGMLNPALWALFPILHGFHEFAEYVIEEFNDDIIIEQLEVLFAIGSSIALLAACIEFLGVIPRPFGKMTGFVSYTLIAYFILFVDKEVFEGMEHITYSYKSLETSFFRFFFGFVLVMISAAAIFFSFIQLKMQEKVGKITIEQDLGKVVAIAIFLLFIFAIFEGLTSENATFVLLRGISAVFFLLLPAFLIFSSKLGLQKLLITSEHGIFVTGFDFAKNDLLEDDQAILTANFIAAVSSFSRVESEIGGLSEIITTQGSYVITTYKGLIITLLTRSITLQLEQALVSFVQSINNIIQYEEEIVYDREVVVNTVQKYFSSFT
ncbi:MAG: hypothetical protein ACXAD7_04615 [Candidatus Kariarchaeaceae archaeon]